MLKKYAVFLVAVLALAAIVASLVNTTWLVEKAICDVLASRPGVIVRSVHVGLQRFSLPGQVRLTDVKVACEINAKPFLFETTEVIITGLQSFLSGDRRLLAVVENIFVHYDVGEFKDARAELTVVRDAVSGPVTIAEIRWDKLRAWDAAAFMIVNAAGLEVRAVKFKAYGGTASGKVFVPLASKAGSYAAEFLIEDIDVARLADVNRDIAAQIGGRVTGAVKFEGNAQTLSSLDADLTMPSGGQVSASLLAALTQYLPKSREKKRLDVLIRNGGKLAMEVFSFTMKGGEAGRFAGEVHLRSREINLELNLEQEINTDGTIASLAGYLQTFLK